MTRVRQRVGIDGVQFWNPDSLLAVSDLLAGAALDAGDQEGAVVAFAPAGVVGEACPPVMP